MTFQKRLIIGTLVLAGAVLATIVLLAAENAPKVPTEPDNYLVYVDDGCELHVVLPDREESFVLKPTSCKRTKEEVSRSSIRAKTEECGDLEFLPIALGGPYVCDGCENTTRSFGSCQFKRMEEGSMKRWKPIGWPH